MKKIVSALTILAALALSSGFASAQTLTSEGELTNATSITPSLGYSLYDWGDPSGTRPQENPNFPFFVTGETITSGYYAQGATHLTVDGTVYSTGELNSSGLVDTIDLGNTIPASFTLGVVTDVQGVPGVGTSTQITIDLYNASNTLLSSVVEGNDVNHTSATSNDIYYTSVAGAAAGDYLTFSQAAAGGTNGPTFGAITFDALDPLLSVPEPKTWALLFGGVAFLGFMMVRRRQQV